MKLQTKTFSYIFFLFIGALIIGVGIAYFGLKQDIKKIGEYIDKSVYEMHLNELKKSKEYIQERMDDILYKLEMIQNRIHQYPFLHKRLGPTLYNYDTNTWGNSCAIMLSDDNLDYILCKNEGKMTSQTILNTPYVHYFEKGVSNERVMFRKGDEEYIGVPFRSSIAESKDSNEESYEYYIIFTKEQILKQDSTNLVLKNRRLPYAPIELIDLVQTENSYQEFCNKIKKGIVELQLEMKNNVNSFDHVQWSIGTKDHFEKSFSESYNQRLLLTYLGFILASGYWDFNPFAESAPSGIIQVSRSKQGRSYVKGILTQDVLIPNEIEYIGDRGLFFMRGNNLYLTLERKIYADDSKREGSIVLGASIEKVFQSLSDVMNQKIAIIHNNEVLLVYHNGKVSVGKELGDLPQQLKDKSEGYFKDESGKVIYFQTIGLERYSGIEFVQVDDTIFLRRVYQAVKEKMNEFVHLVSVQMVVMRIILFLVVVIVLYRIIKAIIDPIRSLENAAKLVAKGDLSQVKLEKLMQKKDLSDEVVDLCSSFSTMVEEMKKKEKIDGLLHKVVPGTVADQIIERGIALGGEIKEVTVLFADIRNFTSLCEQKSAIEIVSMLNECFTQLTHVIDQHGGIVDKYVGDEVMALFGAPIEAKNSSETAVLCALEMMRSIGKWNDEREERDLERLEIGIGINTGEVIVGNIGEKNRLNYTAIGRSVNRAFRICSTAKEREILISKEVYDRLEQEFDSTIYSNVELRGVDMRMDLYNIRKAKGKS